MDFKNILILTKIANHVISLVKVAIELEVINVKNADSLNITKSIQTLLLILAF